jgi:hypothetical protein
LVGIKTLGKNAIYKRCKKKGWFLQEEVLEEELSTRSLVKLFVLK